MQAMAELEPTGAISSRAIHKWLIAGAKPLGAGADVSGATVTDPIWEPLSESGDLRPRLSRCDMVILVNARLGS